MCANESQGLFICVFWAATVPKAMGLIFICAQKENHTIQDEVCHANLIAEGLRAWGSPARMLEEFNYA